MMLPIDKQVLQEELESTHRILGKWIKRLQDEGVPNLDYPSDEKALYAWIRQMCGELSLVSGKLDSLYSALSGE